MTDFREYLKNDLETTLSGVNVSALMRNSGETLPAVVYRLSRLTYGEDTAGATSARASLAEVVIWAASIPAALEIRDTLKTRYHVLRSAEFGGTGAVDPITIDESRIEREYDGDRIADTYSEEGAYAITLEISFAWQA